MCTINKQDNKRARINFSPHLSLRLSSKLSLHNRGSRIPDRCTISARRGSGADFETHFHAFHYSSTVITPFSNITRLVSPAKTINRVHDAIHFAQPPTISPPPPVSPPKHLTSKSRLNGINENRIAYDFKIFQFERFLRERKKTLLIITSSRHFLFFSLLFRTDSRGKVCSFEERGGGEGGDEMEKLSSWTDFQSSFPGALIEERPISAGLYERGREGLLLPPSSLEMRRLRDPPPTARTRLS